MEETQTQITQITPDNLDTLIVLERLPVITEHLHSLKGYIAERVSEAQALAVTPETLAAVKERRADLKKVFDALEAKRKEIKAAVTKPYDDMNAIWKECVTNPMKKANDELGEKIHEVEDGIKANTEAYLRDWFKELCTSEGLNWLEYDRLGIKVDMTSAKAKTPKKLMNQILEQVKRISGDVKAISTMEYADEILAEYKLTLSMANAVSTVTDRHKRIEQARQEVFQPEPEPEPEEPEETYIEEPEVIQEPEPIPEPEPQKPADDIMTYTLRMTGPRSALFRLRHWLVENGIQFEKVV